MAPPTASQASQSRKRRPATMATASHPDASPQVGECREMNRCIRPSSSEPAPAPALEDDNLLAEFLLRLPPLPSSLVRASLVCRRWRRIVSEPHFLRRFITHHRKPPMLGFICHDWINRNIGFISTLDPPDRIPAERLSLDLVLYDHIRDCRHGLVLILNVRKKHVHVWDPITQDHRYVPLPLGFIREGSILSCVVLCAAEYQSHVHGACHSHPFKVVLLGDNLSKGGYSFSVYSSVTGAWGNIILLPRLVSDIVLGNSGILTGNSVCWLFLAESVKIHQFDLDEQNLAFIDVPSNISDVEAYRNGKHALMLMRADSGGINVIVLEGFTVRVWERRMSSSAGVASWMLQNTFELSNLLSLTPSGDGCRPVWMLASDENGNVIFRLADGGDFVMVHLATMQFKRTYCNQCNQFQNCYPFESFYIAGA